MKNIRKSAVAAATALALTLGGVAAANAEDNQQTPPATQQDKGQQENKTEASTSATPAPAQGDNKDQTKKDEPKAVGSSDKYLDENGKPSAEVLKKYQVDQAATGVQMSSEEKDANLPKWAKTLRAVTAAGLIGSFFGLVVFPIINFLKFQGVIR